MANPTKMIPNQQSSSQSWIEWHKSMKSRYGKKEANALFVKAWDQRGGAGTSASTNELRDYMKSNDVILDSTTMENIVDTASSGLDAIGGFFTMGKYMAIGMGVIVIGGVAMLVYNVAKNPVRAGKAVASLHPAGRAFLATK